MFFSFDLRWTMSFGPLCEEEAGAEIAAVVKLNAQFSLAGVRQRWLYKDPADSERLLTAFHQAGLK